MSSALFKRGRRDEALLFWGASFLWVRLPPGPFTTPSAAEEPAWLTHSWYALPLHQFGRRVKV